MQTGNKVKAEKLIKNIIKIVIKIGVLHRNNQFSADELKDAEVFKRKFQVSIIKQHIHIYIQVRSKYTYM